MASSLALLESEERRAWWGEAWSEEGERVRRARVRAREDEGAGVDADEGAGEGGA